MADFDMSVALSFWRAVPGLNSQYPPIPDPTSSTECNPSSGCRQNGGTHFVSRL
jgi:hypothetical protein